MTLYIYLFGRVVRAEPVFEAKICDRQAESVAAHTFVVLHAEQQDPVGHTYIGTFVVLHAEHQDPALASAIKRDERANRRYRKRAGDVDDFLLRDGDGACLAMILYIDHDTIYIDHDTIYIYIPWYYI